MKFRQIIGADGLIFRDLNDLIEAVRAENPDIQQFECSVFNGVYVTKDVDQGYLDFSILYVMTDAKAVQRQNEVEISKCITKDDAFAQGAGLAPDLQLPPKSCKVCLQVRQGNSFMKRLIVGISGASGAIYGVRLLQVLRDVTDIETHLVMSRRRARPYPLETIFPCAKCRR